MLAAIPDDQGAEMTLVKDDDAEATDITVSSKGADPWGLSPSLTSMIGDPGAEATDTNYGVD